MADTSPMPIIVTMELPHESDSRAVPAATVFHVDPEVREQIVRRVREEGVCTAGTGAEAMALVRSEPFDVAICDLHIPGVSAVKLCEQIWLAAPALAGRLIVTSGDLTSEGVDQLVERIRVPPVSKPFTANGRKAAS